jgi:hypothetical protein
VAQPFHSISSEKKFLKSAFIIKIFKSSKRWSIEKKREKVLKKRERKMKSFKSLCKQKGKVNILRGEKHLNFNIVLCESIFSPSIIPFSKPFPKSFDKVLELFLDYPLTWQYA